MKFGIAIRNMGPQSNRTTIRACARIAEHAGFDALFVSDHLCIPPDQTEGSGGRYLDVLATLAFLAGATEKIRLGISVLVVPVSSRRVDREAGRDDPGIVGRANDSRHRRRMDEA